MNTFPSVTIAVFEKQADADLAQSRLQKADINSMIEEYDHDAAYYRFDPVAVGIHLKVHPEDVEQAEAALANDTVDEPHKALEEDIPTAEPLNPREEMAQQAWNGAWMSLLFPPLYLFVFWLILKVHFANEPLRPQLRKRAWIAALIAMPVVALTLFVIQEVFFALLRNVTSNFGRD